MMKFKHRLGYVVPAAFDISITVNRMILFAYCNLTIAFIALILDKGGDYIKKLSGGVIVCLVLAIAAIGGLAYELICLYRQAMGLIM